MNEPREPLHQPPNPVDLRRVPPASVACARVRGWLRDYVDGDLEDAHRAELDQHVHDCRTCAVELGRAEHEVLRLRKLFRATSAAPALPRDFAANVVQRLVLDETSLLSNERLARATAAAAARAAATAAAQRTGAPRPRFVALTPVRVLAAALVLVVGLLFGSEFFSALADGPNGVSRLVVLEAHETSSLGRRLVRGDGLGEQESLRLTPGGRAKVQWHDPTTKTQPAATLWLQGKGELRLEAGQPLLLEGNAEITTHRDVVIPMADGSRLELGVGTYEVTASAQQELSWSGLDDPLAALPRDLQIAVEVKMGLPAAIVRSAVGSTLVAAGEIGIYSGDSAVQITGVGGGPLVANERPTSRHPMPNVPPQMVLFGQVRDRSGGVVAAADVLVAYAAGGVAWPGLGLSGPDGSFVVQTQGAVQSTFAVAMASPPANRFDLGLLAPEAFRVLRTGDSAQFLRHLVFDTSLPVRGVVRDQAGVPIAGVDLVPCLVDEWFGCVLPLGGQRTTTDSLGAFSITRLPAMLPMHQGLVVLALHDGHCPVAVPVPARGSALAVRPPLAVSLPPLHDDRLQMLPANCLVEVFEELPGIAADMGYQLRVAMTDGYGRVPSIDVGNGRLWVRVQGTAVVRELVLDPSAGPGLRPAVGPGQALETLFREPIALPGADVFLASNWRLQRYVTFVPEAAAELSVVQGAGIAVADAQVFGVAASGPRGTAAVRFLGLTLGDGTLPLPELHPNENLAVLAGDGTMAFLSQEKFRAGVTSVTLSEVGRLLVSESVRSGLVETHLTLRLERLDDVLPGLQPTLFRFAGPASDFEAGNVPPGDYRVHLGAQTFEVSVPSAGFVVLQ